jgi:hypothetical protein
MNVGVFLPEGRESNLILAETNLTFAGTVKVNVVEPPVPE